MPPLLANVCQDQNLGSQVCVFVCVNVCSQKKVAPQRLIDLDQVINHINLK